MLRSDQKRNAEMEIGKDKKYIIKLNVVKKNGISH